MALAALFSNRSLVTSLHNGSNISENFKTVASQDYALAAVVSVICIGTCIYNSLVVLAFVKDSAIRTPFMYYLLNVSICDLGLAIFSMTGFVWFTTSPTSSAAYCPYFNFLDKIFTTGTGYTVLLVSLDRTFCLFFPVSYRAFRSNKSTIYVCAGTWGGIFCLCAPYVVIDAVWYNSMVLPCSVNGTAQHGYSLVMEFIAYDAPALVVLLCTAIIVGRLHGRKQLRRLTRGTATSIAPASQVLTVTFEATQPPAISIEIPRIPRIKLSSKREEPKFFRVLALLALCILICFMPGNIFYLVADFTGYWNDSLFAVVAFCQYSSSVLNPLIYHSTLPALQKAVRKAVGYSGHGTGAMNNPTHTITHTIKSHRIPDLGHETLALVAKF